MEPAPPCPILDTPGRSHASTSLKDSDARSRSAMSLAEKNKKRRMRYALKVSKGKNRLLRSGNTRLTGTFCAEGTSPAHSNSSTYRPRRFPASATYAATPLPAHLPHEAPPPCLLASPLTRRRTSAPTDFPSLGQQFKKSRSLKYLARLRCIPTEVWRLPTPPDCEHCGSRRLHREPLGFCCSSGKIDLPRTKMPSRLWNLYTDDACAIAAHFQQRCRTYNNSSTFTSLGIYYDHELCRSAKGIYTFKVQGGIYHFIRNLVPSDGCGRQL